MVRRSVASSSQFLVEAGVGRQPDAIFVSIIHDNFGGRTPQEWERNSETFNGDRISQSSCAAAESAILSSRHGRGVRRKSMASKS